VRRRSFSFWNYDYGFYFVKRHGGFTL